MQRQVANRDTLVKLYLKMATAAILDFISSMNVFNKTFANAQRHSLYSTIMCYYQRILSLLLLCSGPAFAVDLNP